MPKPITVRIERGDFVRQEVFATKDEADHWRDMMLQTLDMPLCTALNLHQYAEGLSSSVRAYGGAHTYDAWKRMDAAPEDWARGLPVVDETLRERMAASLRWPKR